MSKRWIRKYYMELLPRLSNAEQDNILNAIIADELYDVGWNQYHFSRYIDELYKDIWKMTANQSYSKATANIRIDTTLPSYKKNHRIYSSQIPFEDEGAGGFDSKR
jgi:hypothetical protein